MDWDTFLASAAGAAIASYLGVQFALEQLKQERAFDKRLDWFERAIHLLQVTIEHSGKWAIFLKQDKYLKADGEWKQMMIKDSDLIACLEDAELYASKEGFQSVVDYRKQKEKLFEKITHEMTEHPENFREGSKIRAWATFEEFVDDMVNQAALGLRLRKALVREMRRHLGLESLDEDPGQPETPK